MKKNSQAPQAPSTHGWRTGEEIEITRALLRANTESFQIFNCNPRHPVFSKFAVTSGSGLTNAVEVRDARQHHFACDCVDFRTNGLGTCKHVEAVLLHLEEFLAAQPRHRWERFGLAGQIARAGA